MSVLTLSRATKMTAGFSKTVVFFSNHSTVANKSSLFTLRLSNLFKSFLSPKKPITQINQLQTRNYGRWYEHSNVDYGSRGGWSKRNQNGGKRNWRNSFKPRFNISPNKLVYGILGTNVAVFCLWKYAESRVTSFRDTRLMSFLVNNFTFSVTNFDQGRFWTAITSEFSHANLTHLLFNSIALYSFGPTLAALLGTGPFLTFYLLSCAGASAASYLYFKFLAPSVFNIPRYQSERFLSVGSSGKFLFYLFFYLSIENMNRTSLM
ncbi:hypothetical protein BB560_001106 [Smittium megazygosporum]|uniref:Peptidase S54 rhomboid domain-containing protein n=1 Tax=Smittium megazygosporum TaxID=133381 RepID=A0A2T9ZIG3_9FUNG|nr:hypothetical protein BB560_001106 [Smittium megazygosporum]